MLYRNLLVAALTLASLVTAAPAVDPKQPVEDTACGGLVTPITSFLDFQSANVQESTQGILDGVDGLIKESATDENVQKVVTSATNGLMQSLVSGVSGVLFGLSAGLKGATPFCKDNLQFCNSEIQAARAFKRSGQDEADVACPKAQYACADFYSAEQVNQMTGC